MNRQILGALAAAMSLLATAGSHAQQPGYPMMNAYPAQRALYMAPMSGDSETPAGVAMAAPSGVQLASFTSCDSPGCDSMGCGCGGGMLGGGGGCGCGGGMMGGGCGCGPLGGAGMGAVGAAANGLGQCLAGGYDGYNSQLFGQANGPYGSGANCLPRWFDASADWLFWQRDIAASQPFSSRNIAGLPALDANQFDLSHASGFRVTGAYLIGTATGLEATYFGGFNWSNAAQATGDGTLYSVFSHFGLNPLNGYPEADAANLHQVSLTSKLDNGELNLRHRWVSANCLIHSSMLVGARYLRVADELNYRTVTDQGAMNYGVKTYNDLVGAQIGGDMFVCVTPRFKVGGEIEAGVYGNSNKQRTDMTSTLSPSLHEHVRDTTTSFVGQAGLSALYRISTQWTVRAGYQILYVDNVALGVDNFNTASPLSLDRRDAILVNNGDVFYHGSTLGFEFTW